MKKRIFSALALSFALVCSSFSQTTNDKTSDPAYSQQVHKQFLARKKLAASRNQALFDVFNQKLTSQEKEALEFLYAYMPLSDLADYDGEFYLNQVRTAFKARDYFDWGKTIPEDVFRHFVLVYRVNNEDLDNAREVFFDELKDRVKGMTMEQAALEVNHWCHEKVNYRATDGRTSAPLALVRTAWGRCGEESTFTTMAMRSVGIPARQCYTPRWAHTDDNHAWVEVWIDGKWNYLGACEPEPELNVGWFSGPAKRAMMVHTNVFGVYNGKEEKNLQTDLYSIINLLSNYTDTRTATVKVVNKNGKAVENATVKFNVYNYAEFYPITSSKTTADGKASVITGKGDVFVWATDGTNYGYVKSEANSPELTIVLDKTAGKTYEETFVMNPPVPQKIKELSSEKIAANAIRLAYEDSVRNAYMKTFINEVDARKFAADNGLNADDTWKYLEMSQGNWRDVKDFMQQEKNSTYLFPYLASLTAKDLRDTPYKYLINHLSFGEKGGFEPTIPQDMVAGSVFSPRISRELIRPWRVFLKLKMDAQYSKEERATIDQIINYINSNVTLDDIQNYYKCPISPKGAVELGRADKDSRNALFVAICRAEGIAARIESATSRPQYYTNGEWINVNLNDDSETQYPKGTIIFNNAASNIVKPAYSTHYTIAKFVDGDFVTLDFEGDAALKTLPGQVTIDAGYYRLIVGSRANDGSVTVETKYFSLNEGETKALDIVLPKTEGRIQVQGIVDMNSRITLANGTETSLKDIANGKGIIICFADPDKEPTKHVLQDIPNQQAELNEWGGGILFIVPDDKVSKAFDASVFKNLPNQSVWGVDNNRGLLNATTNALQIEFSNNFPLTIYLSDIGGILYSSEGYQIGIPENILKTINAEAATKNP
ncbi:transglutaminase-like domain-containing protein [Dysgonomonas sp. GY617]|uniref:transglutaminase-like domain-containing protein n=1 Tax=Dysgonomonas sp. GY617 TaxID=2780420 RepID=UPI00188393D0|nr:transglutaminase-like domain-containing protein [Dysgonomonas sp. GY617]MBF0576644.1 transglutaminase domain-containing protein [Dysgonomonas sp. GY617]